MKFHEISCAEISNLNFSESILPTRPLTSTTSTSTLLPHFRLRRRRTDHPSDICHDIRVRLRSGPQLPSHVLDCFLLLPWSHLLPCAFIFLSTIAFLPRALIAAALGLPSRPEASAAPARNSAWGVAGRVLNAWTTPAADAADLATAAVSLAIVMTFRAPRALTPS